MQRQQDRWRALYVVKSRNIVQLERVVAWDEFDEACRGIKSYRNMALSDYEPGARFYVSDSEQYPAVYSCDKCGHVGVGDCSLQWDEWAGK